MRLRKVEQVDTLAVGPPECPRLILPGGARIAGTVEGTQGGKVPKLEEQKRKRVPRFGELDSVTLSRPAFPARMSPIRTVHE